MMDTNERQQLQTAFFIREFEKELIPHVGKAAAKKRVSELVVQAAMIGNEDVSDLA